MKCECYFSILNCNYGLCQGQKSMPMTWCKGDRESHHCPYSKENKKFMKEVFGIDL